MYYKEWIKTRYAAVLIFVVSNLFAGYVLLRLFRSASTVGAAHLWQVMMQMDEPFHVGNLKYMPIVAGIVLGCVQFFPEMYHKSLKLTLHLPCGHLRMMFEMLGYGLGVLALSFGLNYLMLWIGFSQVLAPELYGRMLIVALPWYLSAFAAYLMVAWIILEGAWSRRLLNLLVTVLCLKVFFMSDFPGAYVPFLPALVMFCVACLALPWISIDRFKKGIE